MDVRAERKADSSRAGTTIAAIASAPGGAERAVVRLSGPRAAALIASTCTIQGAPWASWARGRRGVTRVRFHDGIASVPARVLWFPAPHSFTCEDVAELHVPGAVPLVRRALARLLALGATAAEPGEFTRRAFTNGRIDLSRAEGILALVAARTHGERRAATALLVGGLDARLARARDELEEVRALLEASLDFDESDTGHVPTGELVAQLAQVAATLVEARGFEAQREGLRGEATVVLVGEPNAGKSSLFNRLRSLRARPTAPRAPEDMALVAPVRGTTRDLKRGAFEWDGRCLTIVDTAGVDLAGAERAEGAANALQRAAEERAVAARATADVLLWVLDATRPVGRGAAPGEPASVPMIVAWNQVDRAEAGPAPMLPGVAAVVPVSAVTGVGVEALARELLRAVEARGDGSAAALASAIRTGAQLTAAEHDLAAGRAALDAGAPLDLVAEHLRDATSRLDTLSGRTTPEDLLDRIFARFCLGK